MQPEVPDDVQSIEPASIPVAEAPVQQTPAVVSEQETPTAPEPEPMFVNATSWLQPSAQSGDETLKGAAGLVQIPQHSPVSVTGGVEYDEHGRRWRPVLFEGRAGWLQVSNLRAVL